MLIKRIIKTIALSLILSSTHSTLQAEDLPRSTLLGIMPTQNAVGEEVILQTIVPNSTASTLGLEQGDKITAINKQKTEDFPSLLSVIRELNAGSDIAVDVIRDNKPLQLAGKMQPRPFETSQYADVYYDSVSYPGNQLRSIIYKPSQARDGQKLPSIFFIQGYTCDSIDYGMAPNVTTRQMADQYAQAGYVVYRVEKPGAGDSVSDKDCSDIDFTSENKAFIEGLKALKQVPYVDADRVYLWGHSLGVLHAGVIADQYSVAGVIGYGGVYKSWHDYMLDIYRHRSVNHFDLAESQAINNTKRVKPFIAGWLKTDTPWQQLLAQKDVKKALEGDLIPINGDQVFNRHYSFFRDLNRYDFASIWKRVDVPVLMMHGSLDIQAINKQWAFDITEQTPHPKSKGLEIVGAEHAFMRYKNRAEHMQARRNREYNPGNPGEHFDKRIAEQTLSWLNSL